ncbi:MAG: redox-sensitive transcriptional activator SoxR [Acidiferrobacterales bacterium]|nr:redox-sensitive transcriptional activator SoxR [Acidiferrobacterales bacterium]
MTKPGELLTISQTASRCGVATSTLRFYESRGLISSQRTAGNQRLFHRAEIRKISIIRVAQSLGLTLKEIENALATLPNKRPPNRKDWEKLSRVWRKELDIRIENLQQLRDQLTGCIGCGCLSLKRCALYNKADQAGEQGPGPRYLFEIDH